MPTLKINPKHKVVTASAVEKMQGEAELDHNPKTNAKLFHAFAAADQKLADLHVNCESAKEFPLQRQENKAVKLDWRMEAMKVLGRARQSPARRFPKSCPCAHGVTRPTLSGIPAGVYDCRFGKRSALEWVIDQCPRRQR